MTESDAAQSNSKPGIFVATFTPGTPVTVVSKGVSEDLYLGGITYVNRPAGYPPGSSSPQWVQKIVVGTEKQKMVDGVGVDAALGQPRVKVTYCTGSSKNAQLFRIASDGSTTCLFCVDVLATQGDYNLETNPPAHLINKLLASDVAFDGAPTLPPATQNAKAWRTMSALSEALFLNFPQP